MVAFAIFIFLLLDSVKVFNIKRQHCTYDKEKLCKPLLQLLLSTIYFTIYFLHGDVTSVLPRFLLKKIATYTNARTTLEARKCIKKWVFRSDAVMGFFLATNGLLVLYITINLVKLYYGDHCEGLLLFEAIIDYGLGGSSMAFLGE
ncbi:unnamed protein product [Fraxinus pennsylvanica]|uniref:H(+)-exporting diphosphatase n=1 Tax=Fraxinus pennsylvanica TaxID=56036 RepID=A0AAD1ZSS8_9LAMI|nr:unnamed protein product [Fraxinus pennsylvanica]